MEPHDQQTPPPNPESTQPQTAQQQSNQAQKKSNNIVLIIIAVIVGLFVLGGIALAGMGWFAYSKVTNMGGDAFTEVMNEMQKEIEKAEMADEADDDEEYDRFAADDNDYIDEHGGRVYATKHGLPEAFPQTVEIVQPSELKQITSQAPAKGEDPIRWHVISESQYDTVAATKAAIEDTYDGFGEKTDRTDRPGAEVYAKEAVMLTYRNDDYVVNMIASQETEYGKGPVGNFLIVYDIQVLEAQ